MRVFLTSAGIAMISVGVAFAQTPEIACYHAGLSYSPGSIIGMGQSLQICGVTPDGTRVWTPVPSDDPARISANCLAGGREFGQGAITSTAAAHLVCGDGTWLEER